MSEIASMLVTHKKASIDEIEKAWHGDVETLLKWVASQDRVEECAVLKTCNRVEIYVVSARGEKVLFDLAKKARVSSRIIDFHDHDESLLHLLRLASGLESMILGEDQILGQMKELVAIAARAGTTGWMLDTAFKKAIAVGKRVRKETRINERSVSVGSAAVDMAEEILGDLSGASVLVIGAGETGELISRALMARPIASLAVTNRTFSSAQSLAGCLGAEALPFEEMKERLKTANVVISATSAPHYILLKEDIEKVMEASNPARRVVMFSATMPQPIMHIAKKHLGTFEVVEDSTNPVQAGLTDQIWLEVRERDKLEALCRIVDAEDEFYGLVFCHTKIETDAVARALSERGYAARLCTATCHRTCVNGRWPASATRRR